MHVMEGDCEKSSGCLTAEGAPEIAKPLDETDAKTPVETLINGDHQDVKDVLEKVDESEDIEIETENVPDDIEPDIQSQVEEIETDDKNDETKDDKLDAKENEISVQLPQDDDLKPSSPLKKETKDDQNQEQSEEDDKQSISSSHVSQSEDRQKRSPEDGEVSSGSDSESVRKKIKIEAEPSENHSTESSFQNCVPDERERMIQDFVNDCSQNTEDLDSTAEKLQREVETLVELARTKEMEWNTILRLRKIKEEMLERVLRRKRINSLDDQPQKSINVDPPNFINKTITTQGNQNELMMVPIVSSSPGLMQTRGPSTTRNTPMPPDYSRMQRPILPKPNPYPYDQPREGRIGNFVDVKSIIADFRARHPEYVPRRGRRMRGDTAPRMMPPHPSSLISMANMALGSGSRVRTVPEAPYNLSHDLPHPSNAEMSRDLENYKDHFKINNNTVNKGPPYPEVTLHPVTRPSSPPTSSLLHGILTKTTPSPATRPATFSPTLARLLTAPERPANSGPPPHFRPQQPPRVSIADILKSSKANKQKPRNEITITPLPGGPPVKSKEDVVLLDDDDAESGDRLVIDESAENEDVPQCQGCKQKSSQFVCAGCGNQWYCSRECQVTAWEEHSEVCSG